MSSENGQSSAPSASRCYAAAERLILGQYRMTTQGKDAERAAKDRYEVAVAYVQTYFAPHMPKYGVRIANCARENWIHADRLRRKLVRLVKMNCH